jgi:hypothetical protein
MHDIVVLFDLDNTLLDNDAVQVDLDQYLETTFGATARARYRELFEELRSSLGYADYLGALQRYRLEELHDPRVLRMANWLMEYPFADRLYPYAVQAIQHATMFGTPVMLSDGDAAFQPRKAVRSGLWHAFDDNVLIFVHKEECLDDVERLFPARHYVLVDDKLRILDIVKQYWGERVTTVFPRQGHYAFDPAIIAAHPPADITIERIGDFLSCDGRTLIQAASRRNVARN